MSESVTDKRCDTCVHWIRHVNTDQGRCLTIVEAEVAGMRDLAELRGESVNVWLSTRAEFGCVLHEEKA